MSETPFTAAHVRELAEQLLGADKYSPCQECGFNQHANAAAMLDAFAQRLKQEEAGARLVYFSNRHTPETWTVDLEDRRDRAQEAVKP